jgi:hypothetical protein
MRHIVGFIVRGYRVAISDNEDPTATLEIGDETCACLDIDTLDALADALGEAANRARDRAEDKGEVN